MKDMIPIVVGVVFICAVAVWLDRLDEPRKKFLSVCIEKHSAARCHEFFYYKRPDLVKE